MIKLRVRRWSRDRTEHWVLVVGQVGPPVDTNQHAHQSLAVCALQQLHLPAPHQLQPVHHFVLPRAIHPIPHHQHSAHHPPVQGHGAEPALPQNVQLPLASTHQHLLQLRARDDAKDGQAWSRIEGCQLLVLFIVVFQLNCFDFALFWAKIKLGGWVGNGRVTKTTLFRHHRKCVAIGDIEQV